ncbi:hypothetical protein MMC11_007977 [Xylographa trunciseda]|nr:hypothetical protein [Xylographa trunciseda]
MSSPARTVIPHDDSPEGLTEAFKKSSINDDGYVVDSETILKEVLKNSWKFDHEDFEQAKKTLAAHHWDVSSLTNAYLDSQTKRSLDPPESTSSLVNMTVDRLADELATSEDLASDLAVTIDSLPEELLREILKSVRMPYPVLRAILAQEKAGFGPLARLQDVDEAILRSTPYTNTHEKYLVKLDELVSILGGTPRNDILEFQRKKPPTGGFEFLDDRRKNSMKILANDSAVQTTFDRLTEGLLKGLDWSNIVVMGGMVLQTLMAIDPCHDIDQQVLDSDIDLYVYGLNVEDSNAKVEHVYDTWIKNLSNLEPRNWREKFTNLRPAVKSEGEEIQLLLDQLLANHFLVDELLARKVIVKNSRTILFMTYYPTRRIQIVLKLHESPIDVFKDVDLDICAMCYNGKQILMAPRCARAIETGYSTFTMNLIWGHQHFYKRPTYEQRIFKYANRGFGLRILPVYMEALEPGPHDSRDLNLKSPTNQLTSNICQGHANLDAYRKPLGAEPGLKTLKRVAHLGKDFVGRWIRYDLGVGRLHPLAKQKTNPIFKGRTWIPLAQRYMLYPELMDSDTGIPYIQEARFDVGSFEYFMRHCEAWSLDAQCAVDTLWHYDRDGDTAGNPVAPASNYDDLPAYGWDSEFEPVEFYESIYDSQNDLSRKTLLPMLCRKLGMEEEIQFDPCLPEDIIQPHLTRSIRCQVCGFDLQSVMKEDIVTPLLIPYDVEERIRSLLHAEKDLPSHVKPNELFTPVYDPSHGKFDGDLSILPQLQDVSTGEGNLRWWVMTNSNMWAGQNHTLDEIFEVLWLLFGLFKASGQAQGRIGFFDIAELFDCADPRAAHFMARVFRRRTIVLPNGLSPETMTLNGISQSEATLFRAWVFAKPMPHGESDHNNNSLPSGVVRSRFAKLDKTEYPTPDDLFWRDGDEGSWMKGSVPQWQNYTTDEIAQLDSLEKQRLDRHQYFENPEPWDSD